MGSGASKPQTNASKTVLNTVKNASKSALNTVKNASKSALNTVTGASNTTTPNSITIAPAYRNNAVSANSKLLTNKPAEYSEVPIPQQQPAVGGRRKSKARKSANRKSPAGSRRRR